MPELPEVETIVRYLRPRLRGKRILDWEIKTTGVLRDAGGSDAVYKKIIKQKIIGLERRGKNIFLKLESGNYLLFHLMLTGQLLWNPVGERKHDRLVLKLSGNNKLVFNDLRRFGKCELAFPEKLELGPDPLTIKFTEFKNLLARKKGKIKSLLMDQKILAGIGNIYADEILWYAGIRPTRSAISLGAIKLESLYKAIKKVLKLAIKKGGSSARDYLRPDGSEGKYYQVRKVYQREGEKCARDGAIIKRIKIGGRSSHFCPKHQK